MSAIIEIEESKFAPTGVRYRVWHDGQILLHSSKNPEMDAARALSAKGVTGRLQWKRKHRPQIDGSGLIAVLATLTISEGDSSAPRIVKWVEYDGGRAA